METIPVVIPVSHVDLKLAVALLRRLASWRDKLQDMPLRLMSAWSDKFDVQPLGDQLSSLFANSEYRVIPDVPEDLGWPDAANHMFCQAAEWMDGSAFYFMEADCFPLRPDFYESLTHEYSESGAKYMGRICPSRYSSPDGDYFEKGRHMVGTGIYPKDFLSVCTFIHHVPAGTPWDVYIENEVVPECHETTLIHHAWNTAKYKLVDGILKCEDFKVRPGKHSYARPVPKKTAVIHGCKDLSLYDIDFSSY